MQISHKTTYICTSPGVYIALSILLLIFPVDWVLSWIAAAAMHELFHYIALRICSVNINSISIGFHGAKIITEPMNPWKEIFGACAGPLSGFILLLSAHWLPKLAVCAFFQTILNLLPIREFDGGRILNCVFSVLFGKSVADRISTVLELVLLITTMSVGLYISTHNKTAGLLSVITALLLMHRSMEKLLAKPVNK